MYRIIKHITLAGLLLLITSCYSEYVTLKYSIHHYPYLNENGKKIAFIVSKCAYKPARGIASFPDGGIPEYLLEETSLFVLNTKNNHLKKIKDFNDLSNILGCYRSSWKTSLAYKDSLIYCSVSPVSGWSQYLKAAQTAEDSQKIKNVKERYAKPVVFHEKTKKSCYVDSSIFQSVYQKEKETDFARVSDPLSEEIPLSEIGLVIQDIYPKSDKDYIKETIFLENSSPVTRRAVIEQIITKLNKKQIRGLLREIEEYENSLEGYEKTKYERNIEDVYRRIKDLLCK